MRVEPYGVGSFLHIVKRGARGMPFIVDDQDRRRFLLMLAHFNDVTAHENWYDDLVRERKENTFERAAVWNSKTPITHIHAFCLHNNHFHLLLEETRKGGVSLFMKKLGNGLVGYINERHRQSGSPFQGAFKSKTIDSDEYLRYVHAYIQVKNTFELLPREHEYRKSNFEEAYGKASNMLISSLYDYENRSENRGIVTRDLFDDIWTPSARSRFARQVIEGRVHLSDRQHAATTGFFV